MTSLVSAVGKCFSFIPRLVVHKTEVQRIFNPEKHPRNLRRENRQGNNSSLHGDLEVQRSSAGAIFLRGVVPNVATFTIAVRQMASDFPEHVRTVPFTIANIAADLPSMIAKRDLVKIVAPVPLIQWRNYIAECFVWKITFYFYLFQF